MADLKIEMSAYSGSRGEELPRSFVLLGQKVGIARILDRWIEEGLTGTGRKRFFSVRAGDGLSYKVYFDEEEKEWFLVNAGGPR